jgi:hypothetical protein
MASRQRGSGCTLGYPSKERSRVRLGWNRRRPAQTQEHTLSVTREGSSRMKRIHATLLVATVLAMVTLIASVTAAGAFPADAQKTGQPCSACHVNPAGGGGLTSAGQAYKATGSLPAAAPAPAAPAPAAPAPAAPATKAPTTTAPAPTALPATGEGAVASALPGALGLLGLFSLGLGYGVSRIRRRG